MPSARANRTPKKETAFIEALTKNANVTEACKAAGIGRRTAYEWREANAAFAAAWDAALDEAADALETEARRRAVEGTDEPVFYQGAECGAVRRYSDTLLIFLLKAARPERYRERHETRHDGGLTVKVEYADDHAHPPPTTPGPTPDSD